MADLSDVQALRVKLIRKHVGFPSDPHMRRLHGLEREVARGEVALVDFEQQARAILALANRTSKAGEAEARLSEALYARFLLARYGLRRFSQVWSIVRTSLVLGALRGIGLQNHKLLYPVQSIISQEGL